MKTIPFILVSLLLLAAPLCFAGESYQCKCENPKCGFEDYYELGSGMISETLVGYCTTCKKFVNIFWKLDGAKPQTLGAVWDCYSGLMQDLYRCPNCKNPFMETTWDWRRVTITDGKRYCPRCTERTLTVEAVGAWD